MNNVRNTAVVLVILAGVIGSYFILKNPGSEMASGENDKISELTNQILSKNPIQWIEKAKEQISSAINDLNSGAQTESAASKQINFTDLVAQSMMVRVKDVGQTGGDPFTGDVFDPNSAENKKLLSQTISQLQGGNSIFNQTVEDSDLKISPNNFKEAKILYLKNIEKVSSEHYSDPKYSSIEQMEQALNNECFMNDGSSLNKEIANNYNLMAGEYAGLAVPPDWSDFHKKLVSQTKNANAIFGYFSNCSNDPVGASLAAQMFPQLLDGSKSIYEELSAKRREVGL